MKMKQANLSPVPSRLNQVTRMLLGLFAVLLTASAAQAQFVDGDTLLPAGSDWEYLYYTDTNFIPVDPATVNTNFPTTWHTPAAYTGPVFQAASEAMLGWGEVPNGTNSLIKTQIWGARDGTNTPPSGQRFTVYTRTTFTPTQEVNAIRFEGIVDDGCIIYLDGAEVGRINMSTNVDTWALFAAGNGNENAIVSTVVSNLSLAAGETVDFAVSLHNVLSTSSDIGIDLAAIELIPPFPIPPENDDFADANTNDLAGPLPVNAVAGPIV